MTLHTTPCNGFYIITKPVLQESYKVEKLKETQSEIYGLSVNNLFRQ